MGDYRKAIDYPEKHLKIAIETGYQSGEGEAYKNLGNAYDSLGDYRKTIEYHEKHFKIAIEIGDREGEGRAYEIPVMLTSHSVAVKKPLSILKRF